MLPAGPPPGWQETPGSRQARRAGALENGCCRAAMRPATPSSHRRARSWCPATGCHSPGTPRRRGCWRSGGSSSQIGRCRFYLLAVRWRWGDRFWCIPRWACWRSTLKRASASGCRRGERQHRLSMRWRGMARIWKAANRAARAPCAGCSTTPPAACSPATEGSCLPWRAPRLNCPDRWPMAATASAAT